MLREVELDSLATYGFIGAIICGENGAIVDSTSDELEVFGNILGYVTQIANMIGEPFGLDEVEAVHLQAAQTTGVCVPQDGSNLGILCQSNGNIDKILEEILE